MRGTMEWMWREPKSEIDDIGVSEIAPTGVFSVWGETGVGNGFSRSKEPLEGPGSEVDTIPMSSISLPWRSVAIRGATIFLCDIAEKRLSWTRVSMRGRFTVFGGNWGVSGLETWGEVGEAQRWLSFVSEVKQSWRGAFDDGVDTVKGCLSLGTTESGGEASWRSSWSAFRFLWFRGHWWAKSSMGGKKEIERVIGVSI